jgi:predicted outer membrane lipoprotein
MSPDTESAAAETTPRMPWYVWVLVTTLAAVVANAALVGIHGRRLPRRGCPSFLLTMYALLVGAVLLLVAFLHRWVFFAVIAALWLGIIGLRRRGQRT